MKQLYKVGSIYSLLVDFFVPKQTTSSGVVPAGSAALYLGQEKSRFNHNKSNAANVDVFFMLDFGRRHGFDRQIVRRYISTEEIIIQ